MNVKNGYIGFIHSTQQYSVMHLLEANHTMENTLLEQREKVVMTLVQSLCGSVYKLEDNPTDKQLQKDVNNKVADVVQYSLDNHSKDAESNSMIYNILVETYMRIIALDFDIVKDVIDTLTMGRMIIKNNMEAGD